MMKDEAFEKRGGQVVGAVMTARDSDTPRTDAEPCRRAYSREEAIDAARAWLAKTYGERPQTCDTKEQDWWDAKEGMLIRFICDHFPANTRSALARAEGRAG